MNPKLQMLRGQGKKFTGDVSEFLLASNCAKVEEMNFPLVF